MAGEVILGELDEFGWWYGACAGEDLRMDMAGEMLHANFAEACFRRYYTTSVFALCSPPVRVAYCSESRFPPLYGLFLASELWRGIFVMRSGRKSAERVVACDGLHWQQCDRNNSAWSREGRRVIASCC